MATGFKSKLAAYQEQVQEAYNNGATLKEIGDIHNVSAGTVRNSLVESGVILRSRGRRKKVRAVDPRVLIIKELPVYGTNEGDI